MEKLKNREPVKKALDYIRRDDERTLQEQLAMAQIPAPSYGEKEKGEYVLRKFREIGLEEVHRDEAGNILGTLPGTGAGPVILAAAHLDTVFSADTDVHIQRKGNRYYCPGINDDTRAIAELFTIVRAMRAAGIRGEGDLVFCANVCEEGLGDLKGVKHLFQKPYVWDGFVTIDDPVTGGIIYTGTGSRRFQVTFRGKGGHSFGDFGIPNPVHALGRAISIISDFQVPEKPRTTFSVGVIQGGTSVNTIAEEASMLVDIRSREQGEIERLVKELEQAVFRALEEENGRWNREEKVTVEIRTVGDRPSGSQPSSCTIVRAAWDAALALGIRPEYRESSTDANVPISLGIPAVCVGRGGRESGVHTLQEWFEPEQAWLGPQRDLLLLLALSGYEGYRKYQLEKCD